MDIFPADGLSEPSPDVDFIQFYELSLIYLAQVNFNDIEKMRKINQLFMTLLLLLPAAFTMAQDQSQMIKDWERAKRYTLHYMEAMPEKLYAYKPADSTRTFAEHMLHLTDANYELAPIAGGLTSTIAPGATTKNPDRSKVNTIKLVMAGYDFVISNIKNLQPQQLQDSIKLFNKYTMTKATLFNKLFEHQTHHRGQTTTYFRLNGIRPPDEELF